MNSEAKSSRSSPEYFWEKISGVSFAYSLIILLLHNTSNLQYYGNSDYQSYPTLELVVFWGRNTLSYLALSSFFFISGLLMFRNFDLNTCRQKIKRRFYSLAVPFFAWNIISTVEEIIVSNIPLFRAHMVRHTLYEMNIENVLFGIFRGKGTWFLLALMVLALSSPIIHYVIKNKRTGILFVVCLYLCDFFSVPGFGLFHGAMNVCFYATGAFIGQHFLELTLKPSTPLIQWIATLSFICLLSLLFATKHILGVSGFTIPIICMMSVAFWLAYDIMPISKVKMEPGTSMFIYVSHFHIEPYVVKAVYLALPKQPVYCIPTFLISGSITVGICLALFKFMRIRSPKTLSILTGGR